ncbi:hypothetical protein PS1_029502 [Malus domestica]
MDGVRKNKWSLLVLALFSPSNATVFFMRTAFDLCSSNTESRFGDGSDRATDIVHSAADQAVEIGWWRI